MSSKIKVKTSFKEGLKKYILLIIAALLIVGITLTVIFTTKANTPVVDNNNLNTEINKPNTSNESEKTNQQNKTEEKNEGNQNEKPTNAGVITFTMPVVSGTVTKGFSATELQKNVTLNQWEIHKAVDFSATAGSEVLAVYAGTVSKIYNDYMMGQVVEISHGNGLNTLYASLSETVNVNVGDAVTKGQVIGYVANTSRKESLQGDHLHFEVIEDSSLIDPSKYLTLEDK